MNNIVDMVKYYLIHKNADQSVIDYLKNKLNNIHLNELILIQIELLYTDPTDSLVSNLVNYINNLVNDVLDDIDLVDNVNIICKLESNINEIKKKNIELSQMNDNIFSIIKSENFVMEINDDETDDECAARLINKTQDNTFIINKNKSVIDSVGIWLNNLNRSFEKRLDHVTLKELILSYIDLLPFLDNNESINKYINNISINIDERIFNNNVLNLITEIMPNLNLLYKENSKDKNQIYKLMDYYIDVVDLKIKKAIKSLDYEDRILLKDKLNIIIENFNTKSIVLNDFDYEYRVMVISNYLKIL